MFRLDQHWYLGQGGVIFINVYLSVSRILKILLAETSLNTNQKMGLSPT